MRVSTVLQTSQSICEYISVKLIKSLLFFTSRYSIPKGLKAEVRNRTAVFSYSSEDDNNEEAGKEPREVTTALKRLILDRNALKEKLVRRFHRPNDAQSHRKKCSCYYY